MRPRFSVVIPVRNDAEVVSRCVAGVLAQTFAAVEVVVVDSGSTDSSVEAVKTVADGRVRLLATSTSDGDLAAARSLGIDQAKGAWTILLEPDDEVQPGWLARLGRLIDATSAGFVSCGGVQRFADGSQVDISPVEHPSHPGVHACLRPGSFAAPTDLLRDIDAREHGDPVMLGLELIEATLAADRQVVATPEPLVLWDDPVSREARGAGVDDELRLQWAEQAIDAMARTPIPNGELLARYATNGGMAAARLGRRRQARKLFSVARSAVPSTPDTWLRWLASCIPVASGRIWADTKVV